MSIKIGYPAEKMKWFVDPSTPYSIVIKDTKSTTKIASKDKETITNVFGTFEGHWETDFIYPTDDKEFTVKIKYFKVDKTTSKFDGEGILGLGHPSEDKETSLFNILNNMKNVFEFKNALSYDKRSGYITIGELPKNNALNRVTFALEEKTIGKTHASFLNLNELIVQNKDKKTTSRLSIKEPALLTLMPVIIAPEKSKAKLENEYLPLIADSPKAQYKDEDDEFFEDMLVDKKDNVKAEMVFDSIAYTYDALDSKDNKFRSAIRLGNRKENKLDYWYVGIDLLNVNRIDYNFDAQTVSIYSPKAHDVTKNKWLILLGFVIGSILLCTAFGFFCNKFCAKKKGVVVKENRELDDL